MIHHFEETDLIPLSLTQPAAVAHTLVVQLAGVRLLHEVNKVPSSWSNLTQASTTTNMQ